MIPLVLAFAVAYPWLASTPKETIENRIAPPAGFHRVQEAPGSFGAWLRGLPVKPGRPAVRLFNGSRKANQEAHFVVLDIDVGTRDLQQCADAVMRLRAEYLRSTKADDRISFRFTEGTPARWADWKGGKRPHVLFGRFVRWTKDTSADGSYASFRRYMETVFRYAGTASLSRELDRVPDVRQVRAGDVFIEGGSPGHAVIVADVAEDARGRRAVLLVQSYMPAQEMHVLRNPRSSSGPWYVIESDASLTTPEWTFPPGCLRRFR